MNLVDDLIKEGWLKTPRIIEAFRVIKRADFIPARIGYAGGVAGGPEDIQNLAELNEALPIGYGQTISQPLTVAFMLEQLQPEPGDKILDIGSGSGWTTALLAYIVSQEANYKSQITKPKFTPTPKFGVGAKNTNYKLQNQKGRVIAIEIIPELQEFGKKNVSKYNFLAPHRTRSGAGIKKGIVEFICADGSKGYEKESSYDKILASASAERLPVVWKKQLKIGGRIVTPIGSSIWLFIKKSATEFEEREYPGFAFVPLVKGC